MFTLITTLHKSTFLQDHVSRSQAGHTSHGNLKASKMTRIDVNLDPSHQVHKSLDLQCALLTKHGWMLRQNEAALSILFTIRYIQLEDPRVRASYNTFGLIYL